MIIDWFEWHFGYRHNKASITIWIIESLIGAAGGRRKKYVKKTNEMETLWLSEQTELQKCRENRKNQKKYSNVVTVVIVGWKSVRNRPVNNWNDNIWVIRGRRGTGCCICNNCRWWTTDSALTDEVTQTEEAQEAVAELGRHQIVKYRIDGRVEIDHDSAQVD